MSRPLQPRAGGGFQGARLQAAAQSGKGRKGAAPAAGPLQDEDTENTNRIRRLHQRYSGGALDFAPLPQDLPDKMQQGGKKKSGKNPQGGTSGVEQQKKRRLPNGQGNYAGQQLAFGSPQDFPPANQRGGTGRNNRGRESQLPDDEQNLHEEDEGPLLDEGLVRGGGKDNAPIPDDSEEEGDDRVMDGDGSDAEEFADPKQAASPLDRRAAMADLVRQRSGAGSIGYAPDKEAPLHRSAEEAARRGQGSKRAGGSGSGGGQVSKSAGGSGSGGASGVRLALAVRSGSDGGDCTVTDEVTPAFKRQKKQEDKSIERAMAVACLMGDCTGGGMYPRKDDLMYWRAVVEGMEREDEEGQPNDPMIIFKTKANYEHVKFEHGRACSSKRSELSGAKGIRGLIEVKESFNLKKARSAAEVAQMMETAENLRDGKWHTDEAGAPFSSKLFESICTTVWQKPDCGLTAEQLTWTCLVVKKFLENTDLDRNDEKNCRDMDDLSEEVLKQYTDAKRAKKVMKLKLVKPDPDIDVPTLAMAYKREGMDCISADARAKAAKKREPARRKGKSRNLGNYERLLLAAAEEDTEDTAPVTNTAPSAPVDGS